MGIVGAAGNLLRERKPHERGLRQGSVPEAASCHRFRCARPKRRGAHGSVISDQ
jgi:hypothetical protein